MRSDDKETTDVASKHPEIISKLDEIVKKEHFNATVKEWEFIDPKF